MITVGKATGLVVRVPSYNNDDDNQKEIISKYLVWAMSMLSQTSDQVRILKDKSMGDSVYLSKKIEDAMDKTIASVHLEGSSLEKYTWNTGLKADIPETIAALKMLRENSLKVTRLSSKVKPLTANMLRENLNIRFGLNEPKVPAWTQRFVKAIINEMTKPLSPFMPGRFTANVKATNKKSSKMGILALMGYSAKALPYTKTLFLLKDRFTSEIVTQAPGKGKVGSGKEVPRLVMKPYNEKTFPLGRNFREARLAIVMAMPYVDPTSPNKVKDQVSIDPMSMHAHHAMRYFSKNRKLTDAINLAYATKASLTHKGSKATLKGLNNLLARCMKISSHVPITDASGNTYPNVKAVPEPVRNAIFNSIGGYKFPVPKPKVPKEQKAEMSTPQKVEEGMPSEPLTVEEVAKINAKAEEAYAKDLEQTLASYENSVHTEKFGVSIPDCPKCQDSDLEFCEGCAKHFHIDADCDCVVGDADNVSSTEEDAKENE
jgi:hypothetical protein